jgi:hypothetical protein
MICVDKLILIYDLLRQFADARVRFMISDCRIFLIKIFSLAIGLQIYSILMELTTDSFAVPCFKSKK